MILVLIPWGDRLYSTHELPVTAKILTYLAMGKLAGSSRPQPLRRLLYALLNGGVLVDLVGELGLSLGPGQQQLGAGNFDRIQLNWQDSSRFSYNPINYETARAGFFNLQDGSNEHTLSMKLWNCALNSAFLVNDASSNLEMVAEWETHPVLAGFNRCKVDYAGLLLCLPRPSSRSSKLPLLLVEYGVDVVELGFQHKDFSKMTCMMSSCCLSLSEKLVSLGRKPELARIYGLLVGNTKAQLLVAQSVVVQVGDEFQIQVNISSDPEWEIDLLATPRSSNPSASQGPAAQVVEAKEMHILPITPVDWQLINLEGIHVDAVNIANHESLNPANQREMPRTSDWNLSESAFAQLSFVASIVKKQAALICSENEETLETLGRAFNFGPKTGRIPSSRDHSKKDTPVGKQAGTFTPIEHPSSPSSRAAKRLNSSRKRAHPLELEVYRVLMLYYSAYFPIVHEIKEIPGGEVVITMELLEHLLDDFGQLHEYFLADVEYTSELFSRCALFAVDCLFQLHLLHERLKVVHSDLSPNNIMFSTRDGLWKLIDFDQSMLIEDSVKTERVAGTPGFTAPEAESTGLFSPASDVWSLGKVINVIASTAITSSIFLDGNGSGPAARFGDSLLAQTFRMMAPLPANRPSVLEALAGFYSIVQRACVCNEYDMVIRAVRNILSERERVSKRVKLTEQQGQLHGSTLLQGITPTSVSKGMIEDVELWDYEKDPLPF